MIRGHLHQVKFENTGTVLQQEDVINRSRVTTVVVCALTSNLKRMNEPGNVLLAHCKVRRL